MIGATGWLGMVSLELFEAALGPARFSEQISAWASRERTIRLRSGTEVPVRDLARAAPGDVEGALVMHLAFLTRDRVAALGPERFLAANLEITHRVLRLLRTGGPRALVYASSGAVYEQDGALASDPLRNPYGAAKHLDELALRAVCSDAGAGCVISRIFSVSGRYMTKPEAYAMGDLILQANRGDALRIRAERPVYRSYIAATDLMELCVAAALAGDRSLTFDSGGEVVEIGALADVVRRNAGRPEMPIERTWDPTADADSYIAEPSAVHDLAKRFALPLQPLAEQVAVTAADLLRTSH